MNRLLIALTLFALLLDACASTAIPNPQPSPAAAVAARVTIQPEPVPTLQMSSPAQAQAAEKEFSPTPISRSKGKTPQPAPASTNPDFIAAEILGRPTDTSVTVNVVPAVPMEIYYEYGTESGAFTARTAPQAATPGAPLETLIDGLHPNTRYYYRIRYGDSAGRQHTFVTQRAPGSTFTFDIQGDSHPERVGKQFDPALYTRTLQSAAADQPDFYMTIGDDFSVDALKTVNADIVRSLYMNQRQWLGQVDAPVFLVNGNHEQASLANLDGTPDNVAVWAQTARNSHYPQPAPDAFYTGDAEPVQFIGQLRDYYAFSWGDALFVVIDPYWHSPQTVDNQFGADREQKKNRDLWNVTLGDAQYEWLKQTLETSTAKYKFVFTHHVLGTGRGGIELAGTYEWGDAANLAAHRPGWDKTIHQLMADNGVTIFFQGHDHIFVRQELDGVIYQTLPEPANPHYTYENENAYRSGDKYPNSGHVRITVSPDRVIVDYIRSYLDKPDELAFSYTLSAPSPSVLLKPSDAPAIADINVILGRPTADSISANLYAKTDTHVTIAYGPAPGGHTLQTVPIDLKSGAPQTVELKNLTPDTTYIYKTISNGTSSAAHTFHTQRAPGSAFAFTIDADPHNRDPRFDGELYATTLANALADHPDFHINLGDTFMTEKVKPQTYADVESTFADMRPYFGILGMDVPLFLVNGNHEGELGWLLPRGRDTDLPIWSTQLRQVYYPNPAPNDFYTGSSSLDPYLSDIRDGYYAWSWGDALFIVLDPFWYTLEKPRSDDPDNNWNRTLGKEQYDWLKSTLEGSDASFRFVFIHHLVGGDEDGRGGIEAAPYFEWGGKNADGTYGFDEQRPGWGEPIHQLLVENHVSAVFHGHDHVFVKQNLDGIVYQEAPQSSNAEYNNTRVATDYGYVNGDVLGSSGHLRVTVTSGQATVEYVRAYLPQDESFGQQNGQVDTAYSIDPR